MLILLLAAYYLDSSELGLYSLVQSLLLTFHVVAGLGISTAATQIVAKQNAKDITAIIRFCLISGLTVGLGGFVASVPLSVLFIGTSGISFEIKLASTVIVLGVVNSAVIGASIGAKNFIGYFKSSVIATSVSIVCSWLFIAFYGYRGAILSILTIELLTFVALYWFVVKGRLLCNLRCDVNSVIDVIKLAGPVGLSGLFVVPINWYIYKTIVATDGVAAMGLVNALNQWFALLVFLPGVIGSALLPYLISNNNNSVLNGGRYIVLPAVFFAVLLSLFAEYVIQLYGEYSFQNGYWPFLVMVFSTVFAAYSAMQNNFILAKFNNIIILVANMLMALITLLAFILSVSYLNAVLAFAVARFGGYAVRVVYVAVKKY